MTWNKLKRIWTILALIWECTNANLLSSSEDLALDFFSYLKLVSHYKTFKTIPISPLQPLFRINSDSAEGSAIFAFEAFNKTFTIVDSPHSPSISPFDKNLKITILSSNKTIIDQLSMNDFTDSAVNFIGNLANDPHSHVYGRLDPIMNRFEGIIRAENSVYFIDDNIFELKDNDKNISDPVFVYRILDKFPSASFTKVEDVEQLFQQDFIVIDVPHEVTRTSNVEFNVWPKDCRVQVIADYSFFEKVGKKDLFQTIFEIETHFQELNRFLGKHDFDENERFDDLQLIISKLSVITENSTEPKTYKTALNPMNYFLTLTDITTFEKNYLIVLFTFMRFEEANSIFITNCQHNREKFTFETCGLNVWIISFQGLGGFKISRDMSIARMIFHVGYFLGIGTVAAGSGPSSVDRGIPSSENAFDSIRYSDFERKLIAWNIKYRELCVPRFISRKWSLNEMEKLQLNNFSRWAEKKNVRRQLTESPKKNYFAPEEGFNEDWWSGAHPWNVLENEIDKLLDEVEETTTRRSMSPDLFHFYLNLLIYVTIVFGWLYSIIISTI